MPRSQREAAIEHGLRFVGKPYYWGGQGPMGLDCSGLMVEITRATGLIGRKNDYKASQLYILFHSKLVPRPTAGPGMMVFFGEDIEHITHVGMVVEVLVDQTVLVLEAAGGGSGVDTEEEAQARDAMVTIRPMRSDLVAVVDPFA